MSNIEALVKFDQNVYGAQIVKLFWIAGSLLRGELNEVLVNMDRDKFRRIFGFEKSESDELQILSMIGGNKFGLLAEVYFPDIENVKFDGDEPLEWSYNRSVYTIEHVYGETLADVLEYIENISYQIFMSNIRVQKRLSLLSFDNIDILPCISET